ncbi:MULTISPECIES: EI24 domain-containing protein [unclassified Rathayibacter]|uniref:EI24 domain-containing protein n=1 Tax=unclassified Rathayibacter TaxID=2609250 RepID=UPI00188D4B7C|nr:MULTISPECIES: EI24 domain-containing protein [unclassified Rathayibacter]MBF4463000.1 EI24 domain-containing protein [Rathayibacter sp. VKM Ac-2879]MBF4504414.1 EI24 domain-containing protein [Rathayibacter sp. VKM Ac-2878]
MAILRDLAFGVRLFGRGFGAWVRSPRAMLLGAIPPLIVGLVFVGVLVLVLARIDEVVATLTPFLDGWSDAGASSARLLLAIAAVGAVVALGVVLFAAVTLLVGDPFYERIWRGVENELGGVPDEHETGFWRGLVRSARDSGVLVATSLAIGVVLVLLGFIPVVGSIVGLVAGGLVGGRALAVELTGFAGDARGMSLGQRRRLLGEHRAVSLGFGIAVYLSFLVPGGAVIATPAATAGATLLLRTLRGESTERVAPALAAPPPVP